MKSIVNTFGGAVTHLEKTFETLEFPKIKRQIIKYVKNNPDDVETRIAWDVYSRGIRNSVRRSNENYRPTRPPRFTWVAEDTVTRELIAAGTALALANKIGSTEGRIVVHCKKEKMLDDRYKITREDNKKAQ